MFCRFLPFFARESPNVANVMPSSGGVFGCAFQKTAVFLLLLWHGDVSRIPREKTHLAKATRYYLITREREKETETEGRRRRKEACDDTSKSSFPPSLLRKQGCSLEEEEWWRKHSCHNCNERKEERKVGLSPKGIYPEGGAFSFFFPPLPILPSISSCCCIPPPTSCVRSTVLLFHYFSRFPFLRGKVSCFSPFPLFFSE